MYLIRSFVFLGQGVKKSPCESVGMNLPLAIIIVIPIPQKAIAEVEFKGWAKNI